MRDELWVIFGETNCTNRFPLYEIQSLIFTVLQVKTVILLSLAGMPLPSPVSSALSLSKFCGLSVWLSPSGCLLSKEWARNSSRVLDLICKRFLRSPTIANHSSLERKEVEKKKIQNTMYHCSQLAIAIRGEQWLDTK